MQKDLLPEIEASCLWCRNLKKLHQWNRFAIVHVGMRIISDLSKPLVADKEPFYSSDHLFPGKFLLQHSKEPFVRLIDTSVNCNGNFHSTYLPPLLVAEKDFSCRIGEIIQRLDKQRKCRLKVYTVSRQNNVWS